jgi:FtsP/CotA-like multicopper oxidase with cupredoxin domain
VICIRRILSAAPWLFFLVLACTPLVASDTPELPVVAANDNRVAAGELKDGQLTLRLELRRARWYPDRETDPFIDLHAFGEVDKLPQIPGPLVRVPQGTQIIASVRNLLSRTVSIHGLHDHPGNSGDTVEVAAGATREVRFKAGVPGTYTYWATTSDAQLRTRLTDDMQLSGAFIVDQPGKAVPDRVFVLGLWLPDPTNLRNDVASVNGKSWPYTERLAMRVGETASWRVINGTAEAHAMHLHGFYFRLGSLGDGEVDSPFATDAQPSAVTQRIPPGGTMAMTWVSERPGNWLFHCHMMVHMTPHMDLPGGVQGTDHIEHDAAAGMGGLVLGIRVTGEVAKVPAAPAMNVRHLRLILRERRGGVPAFGFELQEPDAATPKKDAPLPLVGPPIVLTRGQPAEIEVVNTLKDPTAIHWHGIELESFYDGVPGFTGDSRQTTPPIVSGGSFVARMTPPRAGTFIYHTHWHDDQQIENGVYGPLIVLDPGQKYDPDHDKVFLFSTGKFPDPLGLFLLLNGSPQLFQIRLRACEKYRFRLINISGDAVSMRASLLEAGQPVQWKKLAKDGADLPAALAVAAPAREILTVGETRDFEYQSNGPAELQMEGMLPISGRRVVLALLFEGGK